MALHNLWKKTKGTLSIDLKRKLFKGGAPGDTLWRVQPDASAQPSGRHRHVAGWLPIGGGGASGWTRLLQACLVARVLATGTAWHNVDPPGLCQMPA